MAKVEVELKKLHQILVDNDFFYQVPDYQRPYVWDLAKQINLNKEYQMKIKAIMLGLAVSGALLFGKGLSAEQAKQNIDKIDVNPMNPEYIKLLAKEIVDLKERVNLNTKAIISTEPVITTYRDRINILANHIERMEAELKVLHDQLVDLVAKQR
ncbi:hypothetical protein CHC165_15350 [Helicobacter pylori]